MIYHPYYNAMLADWTHWREAYAAGDRYIEDNLQRFSAKESDADFAARKEITYLPAHSKGAINTVKNALVQRMFDVIRDGGSKSYQEAIKGKRGGVDRDGSTMLRFLGREVIPDLLVQAKVGVYVDNVALPGTTAYDSRYSSPYMYVYAAEDILNWDYIDGELDKVILREIYHKMDDNGFPVSEAVRYRIMRRDNGKVRIDFIDSDEEPHSPNGTKQTTYYLDIPKIPLVIAELSESLMKDIYKHQLALLNAASADVAYITKSNFPFYVEQYDQRFNNHIRGPADASGTDTSAEGGVSKREQVHVGPSQGRRYGKDLNAPSFIHPSSEPIRASMEKQKQIKEEIQQLVDLTISNIQAKSSSAESKKQDNKGLEAGLSAIGSELQSLETQIAEIWGMYEGTEPATIKYPESYELKTESEKVESAKEKLELKDAIPSTTFKKEYLKAIAKELLEDQVTNSVLDKISNELDSAIALAGDPENIIKIHENGLIDDKSAASLFGIAEKLVDQARIDHAERIARIQKAQSSDDAQARGVKDLSANPGSGRQEKEVSLDSKSGKEIN